MGEKITIDGTQGYLAVPTSGTGPGVVVIQEWWGLVPHIEDVCDRFAREGFVALAPDLYRGESASNSEPDEAGKLMMALDVDRATGDMSDAVDALAARPEVTSATVGVVGFCMGGVLALRLAAARPDRVSAAVPYYGVLVWPAGQPDWSAIRAKVQGHFAENDDFVPADKRATVIEAMRAAGNEVDFYVYEGTEHAFCNDTRPEVHDAEATRQAWERTVAFLRANVS